MPGTNSPKKLVARRLWLRRLLRMPALATLAVIGGGFSILHFSTATLAVLVAALRGEHLTALHAYQLASSLALMLVAPFVVFFFHRLHKQTLLHHAGETRRARVLAVKRSLWLRLGPFRPRIRIDYEFETALGEPVRSSTAGTYQELFGESRVGEEVLVRYLPSAPSVNDVILRP